MLSAQEGTRPPNLYALVIYLPDPLGTFLDHLRRELVPGCNPHAHVSVLPPRTIDSEGEAIEEARHTLAAFAPFEIVLGGVEKFDATDVIYIGLAEGQEQLRRMHRELNRGVLESEEVFVYHPHVTLAQDLTQDNVGRLFDRATELWSGFDGPRRFQAARAVFVRNTLGNLWADLADTPFDAAPAHVDSLD